MTERLEALFPLIFDSINEGVFTVDEDLVITSFNSEAERITGIDRVRAIGRKCHEVLRASICQTGCAMRESIETGEPRRDVQQPPRTEPLYPGGDLEPALHVRLVNGDLDGAVSEEIGAFQPLHGFRHDAEHRLAHLLQAGNVGRQ